MKKRDKIYKGLLRDYQTGNKLFYDALDEKPINASRVSSAILYLNKVTHEIIKHDLREIIDQCERENESKDTL
jgi:hypothetical protein